MGKRLKILFMLLSLIFNVIINHLLSLYKSYLLPSNGTDCKRACHRFPTYPLYLNITWRWYRPLSTTALTSASRAIVSTPLPTIHTRSVISSSRITLHGASHSQNYSLPIIHETRYSITTTSPIPQSLEKTFFFRESWNENPENPRLLGRGVTRSNG